MKGTVFYPVKRKGEQRIAKMDIEDYLLYNDKAHTVQTSSNKVKPWYLTYRLFKGRGKSPTQLHRMIMMCPDGMFVDHKNGDTLDNRKKNLRVVTMTQNNQNVSPRKNCTSKHRGVSLDRDTGKYRARLHCDGKKYEIGLFRSENLAALKYNEKATALYGEFAKLNNITSEV